MKILNDRENLQLIDLSRSTTGHLRQDEPCNDYGNGTSSSKASLSLVSNMYSIINPKMLWEFTHKKPVLTPHWVAGPLIMSGVVKLNMIAMRFDEASDHPAVWARSRCWGISAA